MGKKLHVFYTNNFTILSQVDNNSNRHFFKCNHCGDCPNSSGACIEHRDNRLANHITGACPDTPLAAKSAAHVLLASKKLGPGGAPTNQVEDSSASAEPGPSLGIPAAKKRKAVNLDSYIDHPMSTEQENSANRKLFKYLVHSNSSLRSADNPFLSDFANELRPSFTIASRNVMTNQFLESENSRVHLLTVEVLGRMKRESTLLIDGWEDDLRRSLYGSAAARVGKPSIILGLKDLTGERGNAAKIFDAAHSAMADMGVAEAQCFLAAVTDNPNVMKVFRRKLEDTYTWLITLACFVHQINTTVGEICAYKPAKITLGQANRVVTFFNGSHFWGGQLHNAAKADKVTRGLKQNCESRWYALVILASSVQAHQTALGTIIARPEARKAQNGLSTVNTDVVKIILDHEKFWPMLDQTIRIAKPFVDAIAVCESRSATLADSMLHFLGAARRLSVLEKEPDDDVAFRKHAFDVQVVDKCFYQIATLLHRLALFLHPLCRKLAVLDVAGFTLRDYKLTALQIAKDKWNWSRCECQLLSSAMDSYVACADKFSGGQRDCLGWWRKLVVAEKDRPIKDFATAILSIVPHSAEIERVFSSLDGIQSPKRVRLSVETFGKLAKLRSSYVEEVRERLSSKAVDGGHFSQMHAENGPALEQGEALERWIPPMDSLEHGVPEEAETGASGVDAMFRELDRTLAEENPQPQSQEVEEEELPEVPMLRTMQTGRSRGRAQLQPSLMDGCLYSFASIKDALNSVVPVEEKSGTNVVRERSEGDWDIEDAL